MARDRARAGRSPGSQGTARRPPDSRWAPPTARGRAPRRGAMT